MESSRKFIRSEYNKYSLEERISLGELCKKYKDEFDEKLQNNLHATNYNAKKRKHCQVTSKVGWASKAVREFYEDLKDIPNNDPIA